MCFCRLDLTIDAHRGAPHAILFSNLDLGAGSRVYNSESGRKDRGRNSAANTTFWNLYKLNGLPVPLPPCTFGSSLQFVGNFAGSAENCPGNKWLVENIQGKVQPVELLDSMVETRAQRISGAGTLPGLTYIGAAFLRTTKNATHPYIALTTNGGVAVSKSRTAWARYKHQATGATMFYQSGRWLSSNAASSCSKLVTYTSYDSALRRFKLSYIQGAKPTKYFISTTCGGSTTHYLTSGLKLTADKTRRSSWLLENPGTPPVSLPPPAPVLSRAGSLRLRNLSNTTSPYVTVSTSGALAQTSNPQTWVRFVHPITKLSLLQSAATSGGSHWLSNNGGGCSRLVTYSTSTSALRQFKLIPLAGTTPTKYFLGVQCGTGGTMKYVTGNLRLSGDKTKRARFVMERTS